MTGTAEHDPEPASGYLYDDLDDSRTLRSRYLAVKNLIHDEAEEIGTAESDKLNTILDHLDILHMRVNRPREQVADADALLGADDVAEKEKTGTEGAMRTTFDRLRKEKRVELEHLVLNRSSFSQTVENVFALSFLVEEGRAEIILRRTPHLLAQVASGKVSYQQFVFQYGYSDWQLMLGRSLCQTGFK
uniref:Non-structural maintenance of chromosomes element 4 n=1 Tax=Linum usitatissimum TaxID=4006 RepID=A0A165G175_LINUS|nr:hypothetical protein [Linum usitatissimum]